MNHNRLPLPLELTKPALLAGDLDTQFRASLDEYDPKTQLCGGEGRGEGGGGGKTSSNQGSSVNLGLNIDAITVDVQVDDVLVF